MLERNISKYSKENLEFFPKKKLLSNHIIDIVEHPFKEKKIIFVTNYKIMVVSTKRKINDEKNCQV